MSKSNRGCICLDKEYIMKEEMKNRRKLRLLQVRQQNQAIASQIRNNVGQKKNEELKKIVNCLEKKFHKKQLASIEAAKENYSDGLHSVGHAQTVAQALSTSHIIDEAKREQDRVIAEKRHQRAISRLHKTTELNTKLKIDDHNRKNMIKQKEAVRAKQVAMLAKKASESDVSESTGTKSSFSSSGYSRSNLSMKSNTTVSKQHTSSNLSSLSTHAAVKEESKYDAKAAAAEEEERLDELQKEKSVVALAMKEKAELRQISALKQAKLQREFHQLEEELNHLRRIVN